MLVEFESYADAKAAADKLDRLVRIRQRQLDGRVLPMLTDGRQRDIDVAIATTNRDQLADRQTIAMALDIARREIDLVRLKYYARRVREIANSMKLTKRKTKPGKLKK